MQFLNNCVTFLYLNLIIYTEDPATTLIFLETISIFYLKEMF